MRSLRWAAIYALSAVVVLTVRIGLWVGKYQTVRRILVRPCAPAADPKAEVTVHRIAYAVRHVARFIPDASCLTQSISGQAILSWKGIPSTISMGVMKDDAGDLKVHAWLVWNNEIVLEGDEGSLQQFRKILDLPTPHAPGAPL